MRPRRFLPRVILFLLLFGASLPGAWARAQSFCDFAPQVAASGIRAAVGVGGVIEVSASDPNGDAITSFTVDTSGLPAGNNASFTTNATNTAGTLTWTPQAGQTGNYTVVFTASNALAGSASANFSVRDTGGAPAVQSPGVRSVIEGGRITFTVYAGDPDGEAIASLTAAPLPGSATFTTNATNTAGTFDWQTNFTSAGAYTITFTASNSTTGSSTTSITVTNADRAPVVNGPPSATGMEGSPLTICVTAADPDGDAITSFTASPLPPGAAFSTSPSRQVGTFSWTPGPGQAGTYNVNFIASNSLSGGRTVQITIQAGDAPPVVTAPSSVTAPVGAPTSFVVTASDADGDPITSLTASPIPAGATFVTSADNTQGTFDWTPVAGQEGTHYVNFAATSNSLSSTAQTAIQVPGATSPAYVFASGGNKTIHLGSGKALWCVSFQPVGESFNLTDVAANSIVLKSSGTGTVSQISAAPGKSFIVGDRNNDQVSDLAACFLKGDLRQLFSGLTGKQTVQVALEGDLSNGGHFSGTLAVSVVAGGGNNAASITPNPPNPGATVRFATSRAGAVRARVFDIQGRLVRTLAVDPRAGSGEHALRFDGLGDMGKPLPAGIYLFRIETPDGELSAKAAIVR